MCIKVKLNRCQILECIKIDNSNNTVQRCRVTQILLPKLKHALTHKSLLMDNNNFTSFSINFYD